MDEKAGKAALSALSGAESAMEWGCRPPRPCQPQVYGWHGLGAAIRCVIHITFMA